MNSRVTETNGFLNRNEMVASSSPCNLQCIRSDSGIIVQYVTSEIFVHARHVCIVAKTC